MPDSASGVSITRASPKSFCRPSVTRKTPPSLPTSSPMIRTAAVEAALCSGAADRGPRRARPPAARARRRSGERHDGDGGPPAPRSCLRPEVHGSRPQPRGRGGGGGAAQCRAAPRAGARRDASSRAMTDVLKFGGTSVGSAERILDVARLVRTRAEDPCLVVVSAMAGRQRPSRAAIEPTRVTNYLARATPGENMATWTAADLPDLADRTVVVTGASRGLGLITARELARAGARVVLAVRHVGLGEQAAAGISGHTDVRQLDVSSLAAVRAFAESWAD